MTKYIRIDFREPIACRDCGWEGPHGSLEACRNTNGIFVCAVCPGCHSDNLYYLRASLVATGHNPSDIVIVPRHEAS